MFSSFSVIGAPEKIHGSHETWLETEFSASVGTPPPFKDQGADPAPKGRVPLRLRCSAARLSRLETSSLP